MSPARPVPERGWNDTIRCVIVTITDHWIVAVTPMIFNDRVILMDRDDWDTSIVAGWCYDKGPAAVVAALAWDPETQQEPAGHKKVAYDARATR